MLSIGPSGDHLCIFNDIGHLQVALKSGGKLQVALEIGGISRWLRRVGASPGGFGE